MSDLFAYSVGDTDEDSAVVVFARLGANARRIGAGKLGISFEDVSSCRRVKEFDQYAPGPVPMSAYLKAGWWWQCMHCHMRFTEEGRHIERTKPTDAAYQPFMPVEDPAGGAYCCSACMMAEYAELRGEQAKIYAAIEAATQKWPMAYGVHTTMVQSRSESRPKPVAWDGTSGGRFPYQPGELGAEYFNEVIVSMRLPNLEHPCSWVVGKEEVRVSLADVEAYKQHYSISKQQL